LGAVAAAHPVAAAMLGWATLLVIVATVPGRLLPAIASTAGGALATLGLLLCWYPFPLHDLLAGLLANGRGALFGVDSSLVIAGWLTNREVTMLGALVLLAAVCGMGALRTRWPGRRPRLLLLALGGLLITCAWFLRIPVRTYNALAVMPVWLGLTLVACRFRGIGPGPPGWRSSAALSAVIASAGLGFCYQAVAWTWTRSHGATLAEARATLAGLLANDSGPVAVSPLFWCASEDYPRLRCWEDQSDEAPRAAVVMLQQAFRGRQEPPPLPGYRLITDHLARGRPELAGVPLANTWGGYGFAIYRKEP
ncbi:MAG: hypothetical protein H0X38_12130, partial [Planctomycetes bacterium]|nr:hypothetical protein [Planctomycetota bacterium]